MDSAPPCPSVTLCTLILRLPKGVRYADQKVTRTASATTTLAQITGGPGSIVYHSYVAGVGASNLTWLERNFAITVDGEPTPQIVAPAPRTGSTAAGTSTAAANGNHFARAWAERPGGNQSGVAIQSIAFSQVNASVDSSTMQWAPGRRRSAVPLTGYTR